MSAEAIHASPFSGSWYPGDRAELEALAARLVTESEERLGACLPPSPQGFVVPHAGLVYSGRVAAAAYRHLAQSPPRRVVILGFSHRGAPAGVWIPEVEAYRTPLGETPVDREGVRQLLDSDAVDSLREELLCDHSLEIQLPLLQTVAPGIRIVPIYVSGLSQAARANAARALSGLLDPGTVVVASSDFTHYGRQFRNMPFALDDDTPRRLRQLDDVFIEAAGSLDPHFLIETLDSRSATVCGREPIALLLAALNAQPSGDDYFQRELDYETSGDLTGDYSHCVSYAALGYFRWNSLHLGQEDQDLLLDSVRDTLRHYHDTGEAKPIPPARSTPGTMRKAGAFVTIQQNGELRGCVGRVSETEALQSSIPDLTLSAALEDSRFAPLRPEEEGLEVEISILSPMKRLPDPARFRVNIDGAYLKAGGMSGLLLPQVAEGRDWSGEQFLRALARKARVTDDVYRDPSAKLFVFRAQIIQ